MSLPLSARRHQLFVVEDDPALRTLLCDYFTGHGLVACGMGSAEEMLARFAAAPPDLLLLDVELEGMSGLEACRRVRATGSQVPIVMLSGHSDEVDRIVGIELGADDYQCKPFSARELLARVRALLRRANASAAVAPQAAAAAIRIGDNLFEPGARRLRRGEEVRMLSTVEHTLLAALCARPGQPVSREQLHAAAHPHPNGTLLRAVDAGIMRLRRVLEPDPSEPRYIQTVRHQGYMFVPG
jgi:two-component system, OmpR family, phosphate regulon response regulator OmpR